VLSEVRQLTDDQSESASADRLKSPMMRTVRPPPLCRLEYKFIRPEGTFGPHQILRQSLPHCMGALRFGWDHDLNDREDCPAVC
jgi:hypothetical protein